MRRAPQVLQKIARGFSLLFAYPFAAVAAFGRFSAGFKICGQLLALYIGADGVMGACEIGKCTQIASLVQVLSGKRQHERSADGQLLAAREEQFQPIAIDSDCWIGAAAIVMADIGDRTTIGAAAVVTRPSPPDAVAVGTPARILESVAK